MAKTKDSAVLTVQIKNFAGRKRCPYCGEKPDEMEWSREGLRIWCRNPECSGGGYKIFTAIHPEELDLHKMTEAVIRDWGRYCRGIKGRKAVTS